MKIEWQIWRRDSTDRKMFNPYIYWRQWHFVLDDVGFYIGMPRRGIGYVRGVGWLVNRY